MKVLTYAASSFLLGLALADELSLDSAIVGYEQRGSQVRCKNDAAVDSGVGATGGTMDFASDSLEMCARVCNCRQGCLSFTWVKPDGFDGKPTYVLPPGTENVGEQGKCNLYSSDCMPGDSDHQEVAGDTTYSWAKFPATPTDVASKYPRPGAAAGEKKVTDQIACLLDGQDAVDGSGYVRMGGGGAYPGVCASGGPSAKITDLDMDTGGTVGSCLTACDGNAECKMVNIDITTGKCKFRKTRCEAEWVTGTTQPYHTYIKGAVTAQGGGGADFSGAMSTTATAVAPLAAALALALVY